MKRSFGKLVYNNLANGVSILGVLPLCILFLKDGSQYLIPLIVYNNIMDDLDGILAAKLNIKSEFGAILDNVCDAFSHTLFVMPYSPPPGIEDRAGRRDASAGDDLLAHAHT